MCLAQSLPVTQFPSTKANTVQSFYLTRSFSNFSKNLSNAQTLVRGTDFTLEKNLMSFCHFLGKRCCWQTLVVEERCPLWGGNGAGREGWTVAMVTSSHPSPIPHMSLLGSSSDLGALIWVGQAQTPRAALDVGSQTYFIPAIMSQRETLQSSAHWL